MKKLAATAILFLAFVSHARAAEELKLIPIEEMPVVSDQVNDEPEPEVNLDRLKLMGRGVATKDGDSMALSCADENCSVARMVYFEPNHMKAHYVGNGFKLSQDGNTPTDEQIKAAMKDLSKRYRKYSQSNSILRTGVFVVMGVGGVVGVAILTGSLPLFLGTLGLFAWLHSNNYHTDIGVSAEHPTIATFDSKTGWNWSSQPKRVSRKAFYNLYRTVRYY